MPVRAHLRKHYFELLLKGADHFERRKVSRLQRVVRLGYAGLAAPLIQESLRLALGDRRVEATPRHSSRSGTDFNFLLSDLDLDVIVPDPSGDVTRIIRRSLAHWKRVLPFLGEFEIYSFDEEKRKARCLSVVAPCHSFLRQVRKIEWMETAYRDASHDYHRYKAIRAIRNCLAEVGPGLRAKPGGNLPALSDSLETWIHSHWGGIELDPRILDEVRGKTLFSFYLGTRVTLDRAHPAETGYSLSPRAGLCLLSLVPNSPIEDEALDRGVSALRKNEAIRTTWRNLCEIELITVEAVKRSHDMELPWATFALKSLHAAVDRPPGRARGTRE